jgi:hypothetical protein
MSIPQTGHWTKKARKGCRFEHFVACAGLPPTVVLPVFAAAAVFDSIQKRCLWAGPPVSARRYPVDGTLVEQQTGLPSYPVCTRHS